MWQDKYTAHLRATPRAGIEEAEYERVTAKLEVLSKQHSNAAQRTSKLEAEVKTLSSTNEQQLQERQLLQSKLTELQAALKKAQAEEKKGKGGNGGKGKKGAERESEGGESAEELQRLEQELLGEGRALRAERLVVAQAIELLPDGLPSTRRSTRG